MTKEDLSAWALAHGWQVVSGYPSLMKPRTFDTAIVRMDLKATVANLEIKKPNGKWEKVASAAYSKITEGEDGGAPSGLGLDTINGLSSLMEQNKDHLVFAKFK
jgi:hypothetical protein